MQKILRWSAAAFFLAGLTGCYYYPPYPAYPVYPYEYAPAPAPQPSPAQAPECREYSKSVTIDGKAQQASGTACRQPDGSWKDTVKDTPVDMPAPPPAPAISAPPPPMQPYAPAPPYVYAPPPPPPAMYPASR